MGRELLCSFQMINARETEVQTCATGVRVSGNRSSGIPECTLLPKEECSIYTELQMYLDFRER